MGQHEEKHIEQQIEQTRRTNKRNGTTNKQLGQIVQIGQIRKKEHTKQIRQYNDCNEYMN